MAGERLELSQLDYPSSLRPVAVKSSAFWCLVSLESLYVILIHSFRKCRAALKMRFFGLIRGPLWRDGEKKILECHLRSHRHSDRHEQ